MELAALAGEGFRNLSPFRLLPHERFNIFEGRNGQGKTNLLEAIYLLSAFRSFRDAKNRELIGWDEKRAFILGEIRRRGVERLIRMEIGPSGKQVQLDGKNITRMPSRFAHLTAVLFGPDDLALTKAGPPVRRRFVDRAVYSVWPDFVNDVRAYRSALKSRNQLIRQAGGRWNEAVFDAFEKELVVRATRVIERRKRFIESFRPLFRSVFSQITGGDLVGDIRYRAFKRCPEVSEFFLIHDAFAEALEASRANDLRRGFTTIGPHTDDLVFSIDGRSTRAFASQGQHRSFVLALKIAELQRVQQALGTYPIFLLDDVSSELDQQRNAQLMEYLVDAGGQVFITTTDRSWIQLSDDTRIFKVDSGSVQLDCETAVS